jgi:hypothetical protein
MNEQGCYYDEKEKVIFLHLLYYNGKAPDAALKDLIAVITRVREKVYLLSDWSGMKYVGAGEDNYNRSVTELLKHVKGIVRYGLDDSYLRLKIRAENLKNDFQDSKINIFKTKEEALAAIREGKV